MGSLNSPVSSLARVLQAIVDNGVEFADMEAKEVPVEAAPEAEEAAVEETAPVAEEVVEEAKTEEAPATEE